MFEDEEDVLWMPVIDREKMVIEPRAFPRILFYGQQNVEVYETQEECQAFCDASKIIEEKPFEDYEGDTKILRIVEK